VKYGPKRITALAIVRGLWIAWVSIIYGARRMIDPSVLITYSLIVLGFVFIPGPATLLTVARATTSGMKVGIATGAGITAGDFLHTVMAVVGISAIIAASATLFTIVKYLGAAYLVYLGLKAIFDKSSVDLGQGRVPITAPQAFRQAILAEVLNPKTALFFLAFLPQFVAPEQGNVVLQLTILGLVFSMIGFFSTVVYSVAAGGLGSFLRRNPTVLKWQGKVVGSIYCALGLRLALQER
jgi:threonine/homoserine/homoserine lactone efflux protein